MRLGYVARLLSLGLFLTATMTALARPAAAQTLQDASNDQLLAELQRRLSIAPQPVQAPSLSGFCAFASSGNGNQYLLTLKTVSAVGVENSAVVVLDNSAACNAALARYQAMGPQLRQAAEFSACAFAPSGNGNQYLLNRYFVKMTGEITALAVEVLDNNASCLQQELPRG